MKQTQFVWTQFVWTQFAPTQNVTKPSKICPICLLVEKMSHLFTCRKYVPFVHLSKICPIYFTGRKYVWFITGRKYVRRKNVGPPLVHLGYNVFLREMDHASTYVVQSMVHAAISMEHPLYRLITDTF